MELITYTFYHRYYDWENELAVEVNGDTCKHLKVNFHEINKSDIVNAMQKLKLLCKRTEIHGQYAACICM